MRCSLLAVFCISYPFCDDVKSRVYIYRYMHRLLLNLRTEGQSEISLSLPLAIHEYYSSIVVKNNTIQRHAIE